MYFVIDPVVMPKMKQLIESVLLDNNKKQHVFDGRTSRALTRNSFHFLFFFFTSFTCLIRQHPFLFCVCVFHFTSLSLFFFSAAAERSRA
jgi:hypothetical protein